MREFPTLSIQRFNLCPRSNLYSRDWEYMEAKLDLETKEIVTFYKSRISETYDKEVRVKL